jgi:hypothetical protein
MGNEFKDLVVMLSDGETFTGAKGSVVMHLAPGDASRLASNEFVDPLDVFDLTDPVDLRRLADRIEGGL